MRVCPQELQIQEALGGRAHSLEASSVQEEVRLDQTLVTWRRRPEGGGCGSLCAWVLMASKRVGTRWSRVRGAGLEECHTRALGALVAPGPSYWAPAGSQERALPSASPAGSEVVPQKQRLPGASVVAMATTEVLTR